MEDFHLMVYIPALYLNGALASVVVFATLLGTHTSTAPHSTGTAINLSATRDNTRDAANAADIAKLAQSPLTLSSSSSDIQVHLLLAEAIEKERLDTPEILNDLAVTQYTLRRGSGSSESFGR